eukprot:802120-Alexandrium_andersonii.AAC.1
MENLQTREKTVLETVLASVKNKEQEAARASTEPTNAGAGDPARANYAEANKTQRGKMDVLLDTP